MMAGLREVKKARTREHIAGVATTLFVRRGFDAVTVAEIAEAAEVSKMTVFNHFARKEDLLFDRLPQAVELIEDAVRGRSDGESPIDALTRLAVALAHDRHPLSGIRDGVEPFLELVLASPALLARLRESVGEFEDTLTGLLAEIPGYDREPRLTAALLVAAYRTIYVHSAGRILAGETDTEIVDDHVARLRAAFTAVEAATDRL